MNKAQNVPSNCKASMATNSFCKENPDYIDLKGRLDIAWINYKKDSNMYEALSMTTKETDMVNPYMTPGMTVNGKNFFVSCEGVANCPCH